MCAAVKYNFFDILQVIIVSPTLFVCVVQVFLQHLSPLLSLPTFAALWLTILDFMDKYMHAGSSDLLVKMIPKIPVSVETAERLLRMIFQVFFLFAFFLCSCAVGGDPRVSEEHAAGDGHSRDFPQHRLQDGILRPVGNHVGANRLLPAQPERGALQTDRDARYS